MIYLKRAKQLGVVSLLYCWLAAGNTASAQPELVYWASSSAPNKPVFKHYLNIQLGFVTQKLIFEHLPQYNAVYRPQNSTRVFKELQQEKNVCTDTKIRNRARDEIGYVSIKPQILLMGLKLIVHSDNALFSNTKKDQKYTLDEFMTAHPTALLGSVNSRSYGALVDSEFEKMERKNRLYRRSAEQGTIGALDMLIEKWVDVILDYPPLTNHYLKQRDDNVDITYYHLDGVSEYSHGYIYCAKSEFGKRLIDDINKVLPEVAKKPAYYQAHLEYVKKQNIDVFTQYYNQVYGTNF